MQYKSKVDIIYEKLMQEIIEGTYRNGDRLVISKIANQNEISEIPVREAIRRLESEGYVTVKANQGAVVNILGKDDVTEIFQIKGILEGYAARLAIDYLTAEDYAKLRNINHELKIAQDNDSNKDSAELNMSFHLYMYERIPQKQLYNMIMELWKKWSITKAVFSLVPARGEESVREHEEILVYMENNQPDLVEKAVREHKFKAGYALARRIGS